MPKAVAEPWRNTYAHIVAAMGWEHFATRYRRTELFEFLSAKPLAVLDTMLARGVNTPLASSCGRLFDAVAAAAGVRRDRAHYEGQAAVEFEALAAAEASHAYPFVLAPCAGALVIEPRPMWHALFDDIASGTPVALLSARFHAGLAAAIETTVVALRQGDAAAGSVDRVALSGGVFQNRTLFHSVVARLEAQGLTVLTQRRAPANDGGLALGQACIAAARGLT